MGRQPLTSATSPMPRAKIPTLTRPYGEGGFPDRIAQVAVVGRFRSDFAFMTHQWAESILAAVEDWPEDISQAGPDRQTLATIAARGEQIAPPHLMTDT